MSPDSYSNFILSENPFEQKNFEEEWKVVRGF